MTERITKSAEETALEDIKLNYTAIKQNIAEAMDKAGRSDTVRIRMVHLMYYLRRKLSRSRRRWRSFRRTLAVSRI